MNVEIVKVGLLGMWECWRMLERVGMLGGGRMREGGCWRVLDRVGVLENLGKCWRMLDVGECVSVRGSMRVEREDEKFGL